MLSRNFVWPPRSFALMTRKWQQDFWAKLDDPELTKCSHLERVIIDEIRICRRERMIARRGGEYLPLSVWDKQGYDRDAIEANDDKKWNPDLRCMCYRIRIEGLHEENIEEACQEELNQIRRQKMPSISPDAVGRRSRSRSQKMDRSPSGSKKKDRSRRGSKKKGRSRSGSKKRGRSSSKKRGRSSSPKKKSSSKQRSPSEKRGRSSSSKQKSSSKQRSPSQKKGRSKNKKGRSSKRSHSKRKRSHSKKKGRSSDASSKKRQLGR